jgi:hypothetical protein
MRLTRRSVTRRSVDALSPRQSSANADGSTIASVPAPGSFPRPSVFDRPNPQSDTHGMREFHRKILRIRFVSGGALDFDLGRA